MYRFWKVLIEPIFEIFKPKIIVEVGSNLGFNTENLIKFCQKNNSFLHVIDPSPKYDINVWQEKYKGCINFHRDLSLNVLWRIDDIDAVLIDGDHNWYTVFHELKMLEKNARKADRSFPIVLIHDTGWPYGRRDLYYNPQIIPDSYRKPYKKLGILPGQGALVEHGGLNKHLHHAVYENNQQNGVLTAIEDFLTDTEQALKFINVSGIYGMGIIFSDALTSYDAEFALLVNELTLPSKLRAVSEEIEKARILAEIAHEEEKYALQAHKQQELVLRHKVEELRIDLQKLTDQRDVLVEELQGLHNEKTIIAKQAQEAETRNHELNEKTNELSDTLKQRTQQLLSFEKGVSQQDLVIQRMENWMRQLENGFNDLLSSWRWKVGNTTIRMVERLLLRPRQAIVVDHIQEIFTDVRKKNLKTQEIGDRSQKGSLFTAKDSTITVTIPSYPHIESESFYSFITGKNFLSKYTEDTVDQILKQFDLSKKVSIIIPVYNAFSAFQKCIESVIKNTKTPHEILIIDDCSTDPRIEQLIYKLKNNSNVRAIKNTENLGYVKTINKGIKNTLNDVILLNSDTIVTPKWLQKLTSKAYSNPNIATVTPLSNAAGAFSVPEIGENKDIPYHLTINKIARIVERVSDDSSIEVPTGNGFCMYIKREALNKIGLFDEETFKRGYGEENDFCLRAIEKSFKNVVDNSTFIFHKRSASFGDEKSELLKNNRAIIDQRYPHYQNLIRECFYSQSFQDTRSKIENGINGKYAWVRADKPRILYVLHEGGGGVPNTNRDLLGEISYYFDCFLLTSNAKELMLYKFEAGNQTLLENVSLEEKWSVTKFTVEQFVKIYSNVLINLKIDIVHIRHLFKHSLDLPIICKRLGVPVVLSFHDFYFVCPSVHLLDENNVFCQGQCTPGTAQCQIPSDLLKDLPVLKKWLPNWRLHIAKVLKSCDLLITTSQTTKDIYTTVFDFLHIKNFKIIEHGRNLPALSFYEEPQTGKKIKVLFPGNLDNHKGLNIVIKLKALDIDNKLEFHFLGKSSYDLNAIGYHHGTYERNEFFEKVKNIRPSFVALLSIWAETYSHCLSESWSVGVPVIGSKYGAIGERIEREGGGWIVDPNDTSDIYSKIIEIANHPGLYNDAIKKIKEIKLKSINEMAKEYEYEYRNLLAANCFKSIAIFTPNTYSLFPPSSYIRCVLPFTHETARDKVFPHFISKDLSLENIDSYFKHHNIQGVLIQRDAVDLSYARNIVNICHSQNYKLVYEIDDDLLAIDRNHSDYYAYSRKKEIIEYLVQNANLVTVSTEILKGKITELTHKPIKVINNSLDENLWFSPCVKKNLKQENNVLKIGFVGGYSHESDLIIVEQALINAAKNLFSCCGKKVEIIIVGGGRNQIFTTLPYKNVCVPNDKKTYPDFVKWLRETIDWDIGIAPLFESDFNRSKSELRFLDFTALGIPGVYSNYGPFPKVIKHRENGMLVRSNSSKDWEECIVELGKDKELRDKIVENATHHVTTHYLLKDKVDEWVTVFSSDEETAVFSADLLTSELLD